MQLYCAKAATRALGQVLHCNGVSSMDDAVCGTLLQALLLCESHLAVGRRKMLSSRPHVVKNLSLL